MLLRWRDFWIFYLLTFLFLALLPVLALLFNDGSMDFSEAGARATESSGIEWNSNIINVFRLSFEEPVLFLTLLGSLAPALAALTILCFLRDSALWSRFLARFKPRTGGNGLEIAGVYLGTVLVLVTALFVVYEFRLWLGVEYTRTVAINASLLTAILAIALLDQGALLEEVGWRGFAAPELQRLLENPFVAALIIGVCWGLWHVPRDVTMGVIEQLGVATYLIQFLPSFLLGTISVSVIAAWCMNKAGGSILPAIIVHGITNDAIGISGTASIMEALTPFHQFTKNLPFALIALTIVVCCGSSLGSRKTRDPLIL